MVWPWLRRQTPLAVALKGKDPGLSFKLPCQQDSVIDMWCMQHSPTAAA